MTLFCEVSVVADSVNISGQSNNVQFKVKSNQLFLMEAMMIDVARFNSRTIWIAHTFCLTNVPDVMNLFVAPIMIILHKYVFFQVPDCRLSDDLGSLFENSQVTFWIL